MDAYSELAAAWRSERLVYRAVENNDADKAFFHGIFNDPVHTGMGTRVPIKPASSDLFEMVLKWNKNNLLFVVACVSGHTGGDSEEMGGPQTLTPVGWIALHSRGDLTTSYHHRNAMLALTVENGHRGKGYGGEMINWALDWGFKRANLHRVALDVASFNTRAERLYRKLGFVQEGRERETTFFERKWYDTIHFGMLESDWERLRGNLDD